VQEKENMSPFALITGGGTGIGQALALNLATQNIHVTIVGRRLKPLQETKNQFPKLIHIITADISTPSGRANLINALPQDQPIHFLVHSAGIMGPVGPLPALKLNEWQQTFATNVEGPLFLTQQLLPHLKKGQGRILHLSTLLAHEPLSHFMSYSTSKAALYMIYRHLAMELKPHGIKVGSVMPGPVDTPIQDKIRALPPDSFPDYASFQDLKTKKLLVPTETCAAFLAWLLLQTTDEEFIAKDWDIYDKKHHPLWLDHYSLPLLS
jgi:benzil reductase ((S)-benzoin forming)